MDCSLPSSSVHGILQAGILEWVAIPFARGSSQARDWTHVSCIAGRFFTDWATREAPMEYYSAIKKNEIMPCAATWMGLKSVIMSKKGRQRWKTTVWHPLYVDSKMKEYKWTYLQNTNRLRLQAQAHGCVGRIGERTVRDFAMDLYTPLYLRWITNKDLLYSTWNSAQYYVAAWLGGELGGRMDPCVYTAETLHCSPETITTLFVNQLYPNLK